MKIYDISPLIDQNSPVFPGDEAFHREETLSFTKGHHLALSWIKSTVHIGAHTDAPSHYHKDGQTIDQRSLEYYLGPCQVIDVTHVGPRRLQITDIDIRQIKAPRVLFKTKSFAHRQAFQKEFTSLAPELISALAQENVCLIGLDTPSVDPEDSKDLESHQTVYQHKLAILEGVDLDEVDEGSYHLIALPLKIAGGDASPVRAVLIEGQTFHPFSYPGKIHT
ncbi:MAG: cyclase family protein [Oligoflexus sp.]